MQTDFRLDEFLPYRVSRVSERVSQSLARVYADRFQISIAQWRLLATLNQSPGLSAKAAAARCNLDKVKVSRALADLESRGLLQRRVSAHDARASELQLTADGEALFEQIAVLAVAWEQHLLEVLNGGERDRLYGLFERLEAAIETVDVSLSPPSDLTGS